MRNIVWLFIDSFSNLWITEDTMPYLNTLLKNTLYFDQCVTVCPYTAGSWYSQVTGRYPQNNGHTGYHLSWSYARNKEAFLAGGHGQQSNLISTLQSMGYHTKFDSPTVGNKDWTDGWDEANWVKHPWPFGPGDPSKGLLERPTQEPFLWAFHYLGVHHITTTEMPKYMGLDLYLHDVLPAIDREIQAFVETYVQPDDILVLTSDHGTSWDGKRERHHGASMLESGIRTLFAIRGAGVTGRIPQMVRTIDVGRTVGGLVDAQSKDTDGIDLLAQYRVDEAYPPRNKPLRAIIETGASDSCPHWHNIFAVRDDTHKYIFDFYDGEELLETEPGMLSGGDWICADFHRESNDGAAILTYREILQSYFREHGMKMQLRRLRQFVKGHIDLKDHAVWFAKHVPGVGPMFLLQGDSCINSAAVKGVRWEAPTADFIQKNLKPGMTFVDAGAHVGYFTLLAAQAVGYTGRVIAFEPCKRNADILWANVLLQGYEGWVTVVNAAVSDVAGEGQLFKYGKPENQGQHTLVKDFGGKPCEARGIVEIMRIDDFVSEADMVKLDVEGMELAAIRGMSGLESPVLIVEDHEGTNRTALEAEGWYVVFTDFYKPGKQRNFIMERGAIPCETASTPQ